MTSAEESEQRFRSNNWVAVSALVAAVAIFGGGMFWAGRLDARLTVIEERGSANVEAMKEQMAELRHEVQSNRDLLQKHMQEMVPPQKP